MANQCTKFEAFSSSSSKDISERNKNFTPTTRSVVGAQENERAMIVNAYLDSPSCHKLAPHLHDQKSTAEVRRDSCARAYCLCMVAVDLYHGVLFAGSVLPTPTHTSLAGFAAVREGHPTHLCRVCFGWDARRTQHIS